MPIPLSLAYYCQDCDIIMELTEQGTCPNCTGKGVLALARVLNRDAPATTPDDWPESREFYELMQYYRHFPMTDPPGVLSAYESIKEWLRRHRLKTGEANDESNTQ